MILSVRSYFNFSTRNTVLRQPLGSEKQRVIIQTSVWSWSNVLHRVWPNILCVSACTYMSGVLYRDLCYSHQLFYFTFFDIMDAFSEIMDNSSKGKICNWRRNRHLGLCLRTDKILQHIHKTNFGMMMGSVICVEIFRLCTLSASPSECQWDFMVNHTFTWFLKTENAHLNAEKTPQW